MLGGGGFATVCLACSSLTDSRAFISMYLDIVSVLGGGGGGVGGGGGLSKSFIAPHPTMSKEYKTTMTILRFFMLQE